MFPTIQPRARKRVLVIEGQMKQYRVPFYERLFNDMKRDHIDLRVAYSDPDLLDATRQDTCDLPHEYGMKVRAHRFLGGKLVYQPLLLTALHSDLVIVDEGNKFLLNHLLFFLSRVRLKRVAAFGHGTHASDSNSHFSSHYRRHTLNWVSWWFAYTAKTSRYLVSAGVPGSTITTVSNAIDTNELRKQIASVTQEEKNELRHSLGIPASAPVGIYCGALAKLKAIPLLIGAAKSIRRRVTTFHLLLVGDGPEHAVTRDAIRGLSWIHLLGSKFGATKSQLIALADLFLVPGAVGLVILDAFAAGLPLLTTRLATHGPEIDYLEEGTNGLVSAPSEEAFADMVVSVLSNCELLTKLKAGARRAGTMYTIEKMAANFARGIRNCLADPNCELIPGASRGTSAQTSDIR